MSSTGISRSGLCHHGRAAAPPWTREAISKLFQVLWQKIKFQFITFVYEEKIIINSQMEQFMKIQWLHLKNSLLSLRNLIAINYSHRLWAITYGLFSMNIAQLVRRSKIDWTLKLGKMKLQCKSWVRTHYSSEKFWI